MWDNQWRIGYHIGITSIIESNFLMASTDELYLKHIVANTCSSAFMLEYPKVLGLNSNIS